MAAALSDKPAILTEQSFVVNEGLTYRAFRTVSIWTNKLFFSAAILWLIWVLLAYTGQVSSCVETVQVVETNGTLTYPGTTTQCSPFLTPTSLYLAGMAIAAFMVSILAGLVGLVIGKQILQSTPADEEAGAPEQKKE